MGANIGTLGTGKTERRPSWVEIALLGIVLVTAGVIVQLQTLLEDRASVAPAVQAVPVSVAATEHRGDFHGGTVKEAPPLVPTHGLNAFHGGMVRFGPTEAWSPAHGSGAFHQGTVKVGTVKVGPDTDLYRATRLVPDRRRTG